MRDMCIAVFALFATGFGQNIVTCTPWMEFITNSASSPLYFAGYTQIERTLFTVGGRAVSGPNDNGVATTSVIDVVTGNVTSGHSLPVPLIFPAVVSFGANIFTLGGVTSWFSGMNLHSQHPKHLKGSTTNKVYMSTMARTPWMAVGSLPISVYGGCAVTFNDKILYFGGWDDVGRQFATTLSFDIESGATTFLSNMSMPRYAAACAQFGRFVYVIGGVADTTYIPISTVERYDPKTNAWKTMSGQLNVPRFAMASVVWDNTILLQGGWIGAGDAAVTGAIEVYDPVMDEFYSAPPLPRQTSGMVAAVFGGHRVYTGFGFVDSGGGDPECLRNISVTNCYLA